MIEQPRARLLRGRLRSIELVRRVPRALRTYGRAPAISLYIGAAAGACTSEDGPMLETATDTGGSTAGGASTTATAGIDESGTTGSSSRDPDMVCSLLIECAQQAGELSTPLIELYGEQGTCWSEFEAAACVADCTSLAEPLQVHCGPTAPACCPPAVIDVGATELGCVDLVAATIAELRLDPTAPVACSPFEGVGAGTAPTGLELAADCSTQGAAASDFVGFYVWLTHVEQGTRSQVVPVCVAVGDTDLVYFDFDDGTGPQTLAQPLRGEYDQGPLSFQGPGLVALAEGCTGGCAMLGYNYTWTSAASHFAPSALEGQVESVGDSAVGARIALELAGDPVEPSALVHPWVHAMNVSWCFSPEQGTSRCDPMLDPEARAHVSVLMSRG
jgi:hypothetical protein